MKTLKKGFTLVELLVVVAIIGILAVIILMNVSNARQRAIDNSVLSTISEANKSAIICSSDGGTVADPSGALSAGTTSICSPSSLVDAKYPAIKATDKWGTTATSTGIPGGTADWIVTNGQTGTSLRTITCKASGCSKSW